jgi:hypothetical protein
MSIFNKTLDKFADRVAQMSLPSRGDMYVADVQRVDSSKCKVLVGYSKECGPTPTVAQLENFFTHTFGNKVTAQTSSVMVHAEEGALSVLATLNVPTRAYSDINDMIRVSANTFIDENTQNLWQVVDTGSVKYLARQSSENLADLIEARRDPRGKREARFANIKTAAPIAMAGDQVKFMSAQNLVLMGEVTSISDAKAVIKANGTSHSVDRHAIIQIVERGNQKKDKLVLEDYFAKAYGDKGFAKKLTKETVNDDGLGTWLPNGKLPKKK